MALKREATGKTDTRLDSTKLPKQANPLARAFAERIEFIRTERGLDQKTAADQTGVNIRRWGAFENMTSLPDPQEVQRICRWAFEGVNFFSSPLEHDRGRRQKRIGKGDGWKKHQFTCPRELDVRMERAADRLNVSVNAFIALCVESFLGKDNVVATFTEAAARLSKARVVQMVNDDPYMITFLSGDLDIAVRAGAKLTDSRKLTPTVSPAEQLIERFDSTIGPEWDVVD